MNEAHEATLILQPGAEGFSGQMMVGDAVLDVSHWRKSPGGVVKFKIRHDVQWAAFLKRLADTVTG